MNRTTHFLIGLTPALAFSLFALLASPAAAQMTADQMVLQALQNTRDEGFNFHLASPGGLYINWIYTNSPTPDPWVNIQSNGSPDPDPTTRHDRLTDLEYVSSLCLYKQRFPTDTQFDSEIARFTTILQSSSGDNYLASPDERGWTYWSMLNIIAGIPSFAGYDNAQGDKYYNQYTKNLGRYPGVTPLFLNFPSDQTAGTYTVANEVEDACVLIVNGKKRGLTSYVAAGENLLAFLKNNIWSTNLNLWCKQMGQVFTDSSLTQIAPPTAEVIYDAVIKPGELGEATEALCAAEQVDPGHGYGAWAKIILDNLQPSVNGYTLWDSAHGGYWSQLRFSGSAYINSPSLTYTLSTGYKEVGRFTVVERAFLAANRAGVANYSSNTIATIHAAGLAAYYTNGHGWTYQANGDFSRYQGNTWVTSEAIGHAARSILTYELAAPGTPDFSLAASPAARTVSTNATTSFTNTIAALNGFLGTVSNFTVSGLPTGTSGSFSPSSVSGGAGSSVLTVTTSASTPAGTYTLTNTATSGSLTHSTTATLIVSVPGSPDFALSTAPISQTVAAGATTTYTNVIAALNGFGGTVSNLTISGLPAGATGVFSPASITGGAGTSVLTVTATASTQPGTYPLTNAAASGALSHMATATLVVTAAAAGGNGSLADIDIGTCPAAGSSTNNTGTWTINGSGADIWNSSDNFHYAYEPISGDVTLIARIVSVQNTDPAAKGGVMIRETTNANSANVILCFEPGKGIDLACRATTGASTVKVANPSGSLPYWVKLTRSGNSFTGYSSSNGTTWILVGTTNVTMAATATAGLVATSKTTSLSTSVLDNLNFPISSGSCAHPSPRIVSVSLDATKAHLIFAGTNGAPNVPYYLLASANTGLPVTNWTRVATNQFDNNGAFTCTNSFSTGAPQQFFRIQSN